MKYTEVGGPGRKKSFVYEYSLREHQGKLIINQKSMKNQCILLCHSELQSFLSS